MQHSSFWGAQIIQAQQRNSSTTQPTFCSSVQVVLSRAALSAVRAVDKQSSHALGRSVRAITGSASSIDIVACACGDEAGSALVQLQERKLQNWIFPKQVVS
mgnify:CR=1 FL=1